MLALALSLLLLGPGQDAGVPEDGRRFDPPPVEPGYDLRETWNDSWRRFQDRHGRPDHRGPLLQPAPELQGDEYELTLAVAAHPLFLERDWNQRTRGGRVFIHSDDEFVFFNGVRVKERIPMGRVGALGMRYDRYEVREVRSSLFQLAFAFPDIRGSGAFVEIRPIARLEKPDLDLELAFGWRRSERGGIEARVFFFDPFNNASDALAQNRDGEQEIRTVQVNPSVGLALEGQVFLLPRLRAELFAGAVLPSHTTHLFADPMIFDFRRTHRALLAGAWLEWAVPRAPLWLGASGTVVATNQTDLDALARVVASEPERETRARVYAITHIDQNTVGHFWGRLEFELSASYRLTELPAHMSDYGTLPRDRSWLAQLRSQWMPTRMFGFEIGYLMLDRQAEGDGELADALTATNHRMSTRFALVFNPHVRVTFGVGWDLDDPKNRYDQGGMSMTARW